jgi:hypothetical protein
VDIAREDRELEKTAEFRVEWGRWEFHISKN